MNCKIRLVLFLLLCMLPFGCGADRKERIAAESSSIWQLGERYPVTYGTLQHTYTYQKDSKMFYMTVTKSKRSTSPSRRVLSSETRDDRVCSLCSSTQTGDDTAKDYTYYECLSGSFCYCFGKEESGFSIESLLTTDDVFALINKPSAKIGGLTLLNDEWAAYYRLDSCNLNISLYPDDDGKQYRLLENTYEQRTEDGKTYLYLESDNAICYTNGTDTVLIRQYNRSGKEHTSYNTLSECRAIIALLGK